MESNNINFLVVGHVDTGKSTMLGKILALTNHISEHELNKMKQEAEFNGKKKFHYAYVLDTDTIERQRGITQSYNMVDFNYNN
jgi:elongation factor 1 alpha-like protein